MYIYNSGVIKNVFAREKFMLKINCRRDAPSLIQLESPQVRKDHHLRQVLSLQQSQMKAEEMSASCRYLPLIGEAYVIIATSG